MIYVFGDCELDGRLYELRCAGKVVEFEPKVFDLLAYLLRHRDRVVSKDELIEKVWPKQVISESTLTHCLAVARKAVGDDGVRQQVIKTQHGRGYRFVAMVTERIEGSLSGTTPSPASRNLYLQPSPPALPLPDKPSIAVLPFTNMSGDPEQEYFSDGMTEDLITDLSRISGLFVIARHSVFTYKGKTVKVEEVSRELGVRYVLEGSVRKAGKRVRITAQLVDAITGHHLWAERYDRPLKDIFALQDEITHRIVAALEVKLTKGEQGHLGRVPTDSLEAYDCLLRGWEYYLRLTKEAHAQARQMYERAIELDPKYAEAHALLGLIYWLEWAFQWSQNPQTLERAFVLAQRAIALDDFLPRAHTVLGLIYLWKKQHEQAIAEAERAIALNPNGADGYWTLADILNFAGRPEQAIGLAEQAMRLNPLYPSAYIFDLGVAYRLLGQYEEAIAALKRALTLNPHFQPAHVNLAVIYSELGRKEEARAEVAEIRRMNPNLSLEGRRQMLPYKDPAELERHIEALRRAGLK